MVQLPTQRSSVAIDPRRRAAHHFGHARARTSGNGASASSNLSSSAIDQLLIAPYADESHPHVAVRAHLLASEVPIRRTVLLTQKPGRNGPQEDLLTVANASDLVLIGRRTMFPCWYRTSDAMRAAYFAGLGPLFSSSAVNRDAPIGV
jgi:hypothetical protein